MKMYEKKIIAEPEVSSCPVILRFVQYSIEYSIVDQILVQPMLGGEVLTEVICIPYNQDGVAEAVDVTEDYL